MAPYLILTIYLALVAITAATAQAGDPSKGAVVSTAIVATWTCQTQLGQPRTHARSPWKPHSNAYWAAELNRWTNRLNSCRTELHRIANINRNLIRLAICETGGINDGQPLWTHHNSTYTGALGFAHGSWRQFKYDGMPAYAAQATPGQQLRVGRRLVELYGYSPWPACSIRLGLR